MKKAIIIGAGLSGIVGAKTYLQEGFEVKVYDKDKELGGVWSSTNRYPNVHTQNPRDTYTFSDFPMPASYDEFPTGQQVQAYLQSYVDHFKLGPHIHFHTALVAAKPTENGWELELENVKTGEKRSETTDLLLIANGTFHTPYWPNLPSQEVFTNNGGQVLHSSEWKSLEAFKDKKVIVVGGGKSGSDIARYAVDVAQSVTLIERKRVWRVPLMINGKTHIKDAITHRFGEAIFPYYKQRGFNKFFHTWGSGLRRFNEKMMMKTIDKQFGLTKLGMRPPTPFTSTSGTCNISLEPRGFYQAIADGKLKAQLGNPTSFNEKGLQLEIGKTLEADIVILATGYVMTFPFFEKDLIQKLFFDDGNYRLYRSILPTQVPNLAFIGYNSSLYTPITSELSAIWSALHFKGIMKLPSTQQMEANLRDYLNWINERFPVHNSGGLCKGPFTIRYMDELLKDMGVNHRRAGFRTEWFKTFDPGRYKDVAQEAKKAAEVV